MIEVPAQGLDGVALPRDLPGRAHAEASHRGDGRTPALQGVLREEGEHHQWHPQEASIPAQARQQAQQGHDRGVELQGPFDVPFPVELVQPAADLLLAGLFQPRDFGIGSGTDGFIDAHGGVALHARGGRRQT